MTRSLDLCFSALAHPTRRAILARLAKGEATVTELAKPFDMSQPAISLHLKVLEQAGLISKRTDAQFRLCKLESEGLKAVAEWVFDYRQFWEEAYEQLDELLEEIQTGEKTQNGKASSGSRRRAR